MRKQLTAKKQRSKSVFICAVLLITAVTLGGCGDPDIKVEERSPILEDADRTDTDNLPDGQRVNQSEESQEEEVKEENLLSENGDSEEGAKLSGIVVSIDENSIVVNETLTEESDGVLFAGASGEDVTVYFSENADYVFKTIKNSGVNGDADIESREGSFADIREKLTVEMTGFYREGDFIAEHVIISDFI